MLGRETNVKYSAFLNLIKANQSKIWPEGKVPKVVGPLHALCLQLLAKDIIQLYVPPDFVSNVGTMKLEAQHVCVKTGYLKDKKMLAIKDDDCWKGLAAK